MPKASLVRVVLALLCAVLLAGGVAACGTDTNAATTTATALPAITLTPSAGYKKFVSHIFPYAVTYPTGWTEQEGASAGNLRADVFVGPRTDNYSTNINIQASSTGSDDATYFRDALAQIKTQSVTGITTATRNVAGQQANVVEWRADQPNFSIVSRQVIFVRSGRAWVISLSASPSAFDGNRAIFETVLDSLIIVG